MKVIVKPKMEQEIVKAAPSQSDLKVSPADPRERVDGGVPPNHLCGCSKKC